VPRLFSIHCLTEALLSLKSGGNPTRDNWNLLAMTALSNGAQALISTAASQHVSAVCVKFREVVYSETDLQNGASPFHDPATS